MTYTKIMRCVIAFILHGAAVRAFPISQNEPKGEMKKSNEISFDPLGVAAILHNPRALDSVVRLYTQPYRRLFLWPHTMMIGATLVPVKVFVEHLLPGFRRLHPATSLCVQGTNYLSTTSDGFFQKFPIGIDSAWLKEVIAYRPSETPINDIMIINMDYVDRSHDRKYHSQWRLRVIRFASSMITLLTGLIIVSGTVFGVLLIDIWAVVLFSLYGMHWLATFAMSITSLVRRVYMPIAQNSNRCYAIYQRNPYGLVIFKGRSDTMERWARSSWNFQSNLRNNLIHWFWVSTGSLAAICSVACMVNMHGYMQLAFLGLLTYSSLAEILASSIVRSFEIDGMPERVCLVSNNITQTRSIIEATIGVPSAFRLDGLDWIKLQELPQTRIFQKMQNLLAEMSRFQKAIDSGTMSLSELEFDDERNRVMAEFMDTMGSETLEAPDPQLKARILHEVNSVVEGWWDERRTVHQPV